MVIRVFSGTKRGAVLYIESCVPRIYNRGCFAPQGAAVPICFTPPPKPCVFAHALGARLGTIKYIASKLDNVKILARCARKIDRVKHNSRVARVSYIVYGLEVLSNRL